MQENCFSFDLHSHQSDKVIQVSKNIGNTTVTARFPHEDASRLAKTFFSKFQDFLFLGKQFSFILSRTQREKKRTISTRNLFVVGFAAHRKEIAEN